MSNRAFLTSDEIADARLVAAAPDMHEFIKQIHREAGIVGNEKLFYTTSAILAKVNGE